MDVDQHWLVNCLNASLDPNHQVRSFAETSLQQASLQPGFGVALARAAANRELAYGLRQLAAVLLKQYIKKHWNEDDDDFENPVVPSFEKASIRELLLTTLDDPYKKICTAVGVAVSTIAQHDWPDNWPELLPFILNLINDQTRLNAVHGALRCLALLSSDMDDKMVPRIVPVLFPCLLVIVSSPQRKKEIDTVEEANICSIFQIYEKGLRAKAFSVVYNCTSMLGVMSGVYKTETRSLILPMIQPWMEQFSSALKHPVPSEDPDDWSIRMEVLKCLNQFIQNFPTIVDFKVMEEPLWVTFVSLLEVYKHSSIEGVEDSYDGRYDSDGSEKSLETLVIQLFEFLLTVAASPGLRKALMDNVKELVYYTIGFQQITEQQVHMWSLDVNQYVADEDYNTYSCRVSGGLLLEEVINLCGMEGVDAVIDSVKRRIRESQQEKDAGSPGWWKLQEAALFALASVSEQLLEVEVLGPTLGNMLGEISTNGVAAGVNEHPFLCARMFSSIAKFSSVIHDQIKEHLLYAAIKTTSLDVSPPVKVGACMAISKLILDAKSGIMQNYAVDLFSSLVDLLKNASDETMHLVLETLQAAVKAGHEISASIESNISPVILNLWVSHVSDPFISIEALEVLEEIKNVPGCIHPLVSRVLPYIGPILSNPQQQPEGLVAGSLDLITMLLKNAPIDVIKAVYPVSFDAVVRIVLQSSDHSELQNATQCLAAFVSGGKQDMLAWSGDPGFTMRSLLDVASRLLDPDLESSGSLFVGSFILQLILHLPSQMAQHIRNLMTALIKRMQSSNISSLKSSLILIFARLVHMSIPHCEQFVDLLVSVPAESHQNAFSYLMFEWTKQQGEIQGAYPIKVTTTALGLLLLTKHAALDNVTVNGTLIKSNEGITTRSRAKAIPFQWTTVPLPVKILAIIADTLMEMQEQVDGDDDEDSEWEEVVNGDAGDEDLLYSAGATSSHSRPSNEYLDALAKAFNEDQDDDEEDELLSSTDPLNEINMVNYLVDTLKKLYESDSAHFEHLFQSLTKPQQNAIELVLRRGGGM